MMVGSRRASYKKVMQGILMSGKKRSILEPSGNLSAKEKTSKTDQIGIDFV